MILTPYTYLIGWPKYDRWYYGVEFKKTADPSNLWVKYFTSSDIIPYCRAFWGEPDVIEVRKIFNNKEKAAEWEHKVLRRMKVVNSDKWLNQSDGNGKFFNFKGAPKGRIPWNKNKHYNSEQLEKFLLVMKDPIRCSKISRALLGGHHSEEHNKRNRESHLGQISWNKGKNYPQVAGDLNPSKRPEIKQILSEKRKLWWAQKKLATALLEA